MNTTDFAEIKKRADTLEYSSIRYIGYEDVAGYTIEIANDDLLLLLGYNEEAQCQEYHWAARDAAVLAEYLGKRKTFILSFVPHEWIHKLECAGLQVRNAWHDYFLNSLDRINSEALIGMDFLALSECVQASWVTQSCRGQSRGFTGQSPQWIADWISGTDTNIRNGAILVHRLPEGEIVGIVCTGTYAHESEKGPIVWVREVAVSPPYQNRGIGRRLIMQALAYGKHHGAKRAFLAVDEENVNAIQLYASIGFMPSDEKSQIDMVKV